MYHVGSEGKGGAYADGGSETESNQVPRKAWGIGKHNKKKGGGSNAAEVARAAGVAGAV